MGGVFNYGTDRADLRQIRPGASPTLQRRQAGRSIDLDYAPIEGNYRQLDFLLDCAVHVSFRANWVCFDARTKDSAEKIADRLPKWDRNSRQREKAHGLRAALTLIAEVETQRKLVGQTAKYLLGVVAAAVFTDDEARTNYGA